MQEDSCAQLQKQLDDANHQQAALLASSQTASADAAQKALDLQQALDAAVLQASSGLQQSNAEKEACIASIQVCVRMMMMRKPDLELAQTHQPKPKSYASF